MRRRLLIALTLLAAVIAVLAFTSAPVRVLGYSSAGAGWILAIAGFVRRALRADVSQHSAGYR